MNDYDDYEDNDDDDYLEDENPVVSKSQKKREMHALLKMVEHALQLSDDKLAQTGLDEKILGAFREVRRMKASGARNRQLKYITKLLTHEDSSTLEKFLLEADENREKENQRFHQLEQLRERLIAEGDEAISLVIDHYPEADRQHLRTLIRQAQKELAAQKPPSAARKLFKYLRSLDDQA
jgi:ribosome-associated protein